MYTFFIVLDGQGELVGRVQHRMYTDQSYVVMGHESGTIWNV